jgi:hypothetical protein
LKKTQIKSFTTIYKDNQNRKYLQKLLNYQAGRLGFKRPSGLIKNCKEVQALKEDKLDLGRECFELGNMQNWFKSLLDKKEKLNSKNFLPLQHKFQ